MIGSHDLPALREAEPKKQRHDHRRDYNELVNGREYVDNVLMKIVARAHEKDESERSEEDNLILMENANLLPAAIIYLKRKREKQMLKDRLLESEETPEIIQDKSVELAEMIKTSRHVVIYTGAGISTSASIPDYRGPNGLWTQIRRNGSFSMTRIFKDLSKAEPTYTHMAINELCRRKIVKHIVSQNFDGLHLRSGVNYVQLSEIHGNMFIEICPTCEKQYYRQADVTQKTVRFRHKTGRLCHKCPGPNNNLLDTIVLFGERSRSKWPMNWERASKAAKQADLIICLGSSLKTLRRYGCLWPKSISKNLSTATSSRRQHNNSSAKHETKLVIVNLQHTSKDKNAVLKINGKCDLVLQHVMNHLGIEVPDYDLSTDPLQQMAVPFSNDELENLQRGLIFGQKQIPSSVKSERLSIKQETIQEVDIGMEVEEKKGIAISNNRNVENEIGGNQRLSCDDVTANDNYPVLRRSKRISRSSSAEDTEQPKPEPISGTTSMANDERCSPSLFVSELNHDPNKRRLRMRIRAMTPSDV